MWTPTSRAGSPDSSSFWRPGAFEWYVERLSRALQGYAPAQGLVIETYIESALSLDARGEVTRRVEAFEPGGLLFVRQTEGTFRNDVRTGAKFDLTLVVPGRERPVWRARLSTDTKGHGEGDPDQVTLALLSRLRSDGVTARRSRTI
jgi:hypothetical protein